MADDPIQGLIDYVNDIKPFHTKIVEVALGYSQNDDVDITISEDIQLDVTLIIPSNTVGSPEVPVQICDKGWGITWDRPSPYVVVAADSASDFFTIPGDHTLVFTPGTVFEVRDPGILSGGSPQTVFGSPSIYSYVVGTSAYDGGNQETIITNGGGSPDLTGSEFFFTIPAQSRGDIFVIYDVASTTALGNTIVVNTDTPTEFLYGRSFEIRDATNALLNKNYHILTTTVTSPTTVEIITTESVLVDTVTDGDLVFSSDGWSGPDFCSDIPLGLNQNFIIDELVQQWQFIGSPATLFGSPALGSPCTFSQPPFPFVENAFQYFILGADPVTNEFLVEGNVSTALAGSPATVCVQHSVTSPYNPSGSPRFVLNANNQTYTVTSSSYDLPTNRTTFVVSTAGSPTGIIDPYPTGWIVPGTCPLVLGGSPGAAAGSPSFILAFGAFGGEGSDAYGTVYTSDGGKATTWASAHPLFGSPVTSISFPNPTGAVYASSISTWVVAARPGSGTNNIWYSLDDGASWAIATDTITNASNARTTGVDWSPTLSRFVIGGNVGQIQRSADGITWVNCANTNQTGGFGGSPLNTPFGFSQVISIHWSAGLSLFLAGGTGNEVAHSADGDTWTLTTQEPGGSGSSDIDVISSVGSRVFVGRDNGSVFYTDNITGGSPAWTAPTFDFGISPGDPGAIVSDGGSPNVILIGAVGFNNAEYVWRSTDNGVNFTRVNVESQFGGSPPPVSNIDTFSLIWDNDSELFIQGGQDRGGSPRLAVLMTSPDGLTWTLQVAEKFLHGVLPVGSGSPVTFFDYNEFTALASKNQG